MAIKQKDIKLLWGRAGNRCSICKCRLTVDAVSSSSSYVIGEQAHIIGESENAARGKSNLTLEERNSYPNLILLCPTCHTKIDTDYEDFPPEKLFIMKSEHETFIEESLSIIKDNKELANDLVYSHIIDSAVELCLLEKWDIWISGISSTSLMINKELVNSIELFNDIIFKAILPTKYININKSVQTLSLVLRDLFNVYFLHVRSKEKVYIADRFYKAGGRYNSNYHQDLEKYSIWEKKVTLLSFEATKAANWFADSVREELNPLFFTTEGRFTIVQGPDMEMKYTTYIPQYSDEEKIQLPSCYELTDLNIYK